MKNSTELDCRIECLLCNGSTHLSMYAFRARERIVGWVFLCDLCNKKTDDLGYQLRWYFEDENGKKLFCSL